MRFLKSKDTGNGGQEGIMRPTGTLTMEKISGLKIPSSDGDITLSEIKEYALPHYGLEPEVAQWRALNQVNINRGLEKILIAKECGIPTFWGTLWAKKTDAEGKETDFGIVSFRVVTDVGVNYIASTMMDGSSHSWPFKFHGLGIGTAAESVADTALGTELTTEYNPDSTRATGTQAPTTNVYVTVGVTTLDSGTNIAITEHGLFSEVSSGTLLDRSKFSVITLSANDTLTTTYSLTLSSGG